MRGIALNTLKKALAALVSIVLLFSFGYVGVGQASSPTPTPEVKKLEESVESLPEGTAGLADSLAIKTARKWRGDARLAELLAPGLNCLTEDGKTLRGSQGAFTFYCCFPALATENYKLVASFDGVISYVKELKADRMAVADWAVDSDETVIFTRTPPGRTSSSKPRAASA